MTQNLRSVANDVDTQRTIGVTELALRDAHQSLMATRMAIEDMVGACADIDGAGYWSVECWGVLLMTRVSGSLTRILGSVCGRSAR